MKRMLWLALPLLVAAAPQDTPPPGMALATLNIQQGGTRDAEGVYRGGTFKLVDKFEAPAEHGPRDALIAFEGPGWESDKVAYRLYLDERNVPDIYGKKLPGPILPRIGQGKDDYHSMADWGMDILQVNQSLGTGGIGVLRGGKVTQLGPSQVSASVTNHPSLAEVRVESRGFAGDGGPANMVATYSIAAGSRVTHVEAVLTGRVPQMIAGIIRHPGVTLVQGKAKGWGYFGTWGDQSLAKDGLGIVLFYPLDEASGTLVGETDITIGFCSPSHFRYAFAAAWIQEPTAPKSLQAFDAWARATAVELDRTDPQPTSYANCISIPGIRDALSKSYRSKRAGE
jgi:hypothetical protein